MGDVIATEEKLLIANPDSFKSRFNIDVHTETEVTLIDRKARLIDVLDLRTGTTR